MEVLTSVQIGTLPFERFETVLESERFSRLIGGAAA